MRMNPILLLIGGLSLSACSDRSGPSPVGPSPVGPSSGTLVVSTSTQGDDPDQDGYQLTVDDADSLELNPTGTVETDLPSGRHSLRLLGVAGHCSVAPGATLEVDVPSGSTIPVLFEVSCPATGARVTVTTTGLDIDPDGYHVSVDGTEQGAIPSGGSVLTRLDPGSRTIALTGLTPNCAVNGPGLRTVTIVAAEVAPIEFAVVCTATSGVIGIVVEASGTDVEGRYQAMVDGAGHGFDGPSGPTYIALPAGDHVVSLVAPANCSLETEPQPVMVTGGGLVRDTIEVTFSVHCGRGFGLLRITAPTTGPTPTNDYSVWMCGFADTYSCNYSNHTRLGALGPSDTLIVGASLGVHRLWLQDLPGNCSPRNASAYNPTPPFTVTNGDTLNFRLQVYC